MESDLFPQMPSVGPLRLDNYKSHTLKKTDAPLPAVIGHCLPVVLK